MTETHPAAATDGIAFVVTLPGELRAGRTFAGAVADIEIAIEGAEGDLAVCTATQGNVGFLDKIEEVIVPGIRDWDKNGVRVYVNMCPKRSASACTSLYEG